jgi:predicted nucleotidyltransferase component of viral defense system
MILRSEILERAEQEGVPPDTIDKNWVLGHFLAELFRSEWACQYLIFKGGTCLKKCYFKNYRFSEDLDFTLTALDFIVTPDLIHAVCDGITKKIGISFSPIEIKSVNSDNKHVGYKSTVKFWGANHKRNQRPTLDTTMWMTSMKIEMISYEKVVDPPGYRILLDDFSDSTCF